MFCLYFIFQSQAPLPPLEGSKRSPKKPGVLFFSRFAALCAEIIHKVSQKRLNQVKMSQFELFQ